MNSIFNTKWKIDTAHSEVGFKVKHMMISTVSGYFQDYDAKVQTKDDDFTKSNFEFYAKVDSINTNNKDRDLHLKSDDFFSASLYPKIIFKSKSFDGDTLIGDLTIKNVTKEIKLDTEYNGIAVDPYGQTKAGFEMEGSINRKDFDLSWSAVTEAGNIVVGDKVKLVINLQFIKESN